MTDERGDVLTDNLPDEIKVDVEVAVHDAVTQPDDLTPRDVRVGTACALADARGGFADDLEGLEDRELVEVLPAELRVVVLRQAQEAAKSAALRAASSMSMR